MTSYEKLLDEVAGDGIEVIEFNFDCDDLHGLYLDGHIAINKDLPTNEKLLTLYEEWGHAKTTGGDILDQTNLDNRKQELTARRWAHEKFMPLEKFIQLIIDNRPQDTWELLEILDVPYTYLSELIHYYQQKYGLYKEFDNGCIWFDPIDIALYNV